MHARIYEMGSMMHGDETKSLQADARSVSNFEFGKIKLHNEERQTTNEIASNSLTQ
jgi:hypothetical protein